MHEGQSTTNGTALIERTVIDSTVLQWVAIEVFYNPEDKPTEMISDLFFASVQSYCEICIVCVDCCVSAL